MEAPIDTVIGTWPADAGTPHVTNGDLTLEEYYQKRTGSRNAVIIDPIDLVLSTKKGSYNEVLLYSKPRNPVRIVGVFATVSADNPRVLLTTEEFHQKLKNNARSLGVPFVIIKHKVKSWNPEPAFLIRQTSYSSNRQYCLFVVTVNGYRYLIRKYDDKDYFSVGLHS